MRRIQCCPARIKPLLARVLRLRFAYHVPSCGKRARRWPKAELTLRILQDVKLSLRIIEGITEFHTQLLSWTCARLKRVDKRLPKQHQPLR